RHDPSPARHGKPVILRIQNRDRHKNRGDDGKNDQSSQIAAQQRRALEINFFLVVGRLVRAAIFKIGHDFASLSFSNRFQIESETGITPSREMRTNSHSSKAGSDLIVSSVTGFCSFDLAFRSTTAMRSSASLGSW